MIATKAGGGLLMGYDAVMKLYNPDKKFLSCLTNAEAINAGWIMKGDTLEELAANITALRPSLVDFDKVRGIDPEALVATVAEYNECCEAGEDPKFHRDPETLIPLAPEGPYYAVQMQNGLDFIEGSPVRNGNCQTMDPFYEPIPRLYSTGECGSFNSLVYVIGGIVQALTTGRIAGADAAQLEPWC